MQELLRMTPNWNWKRGVTILILVAFTSVLLVAPTVASADEGDTQSSEAGLGVASGLLTIVYLPFKLAYAIGGGVVGGVAYILTGANEDVGKSIWEPSFYGTYVITPDHLKGNEPVRFFGVSPYEESNQELHYDEDPYERGSSEKGEMSEESLETEKP